MKVAKPEPRCSNSGVSTAFKKPQMPVSMLPNRYRWDYPTSLRSDIMDFISGSKWLPNDLY